MLCIWFRNVIDAIPSANPWYESVFIENGAIFVIKLRNTHKKNEKPEKFASQQSVSYFLRASNFLNVQTHPLNTLQRQALFFI